MYFRYILSRDKSRNDSLNLRKDYVTVQNTVVQ